MRRQGHPAARAAARIASGGGRSILITSLTVVALVVPWRNAARAQAPGSHTPEWSYDDPVAAGWSTSMLDEALVFADSIGSEAIFIVHDRAVVVDWGQTSRPFKVMSIRKSLLSALIGTQVAAGALRLDATLADLGIDDRPPLTDGEKQARVADLLTARSGVYHPAAYETPGMADRRPARGTHPPGTFWFYNNWDFNTLGTIYERVAGKTVHEGFDEFVAEPLGMQDFVLEEHVETVRDSSSIHPARLFRLSARDLARFGLLFLEEGRWDSRQVLPADWVRESTRLHADIGVFGGFAYMWWVAREGLHYPFVEIPSGTYSARGTGEQNLVVIPALDLVIVHLADVDRPQGPMHVTDFGRLLGKLLAAHAGG